MRDGQSIEPAALGAGTVGPNDRQPDRRRAVQLHASWGLREQPAGYDTTASWPKRSRRWSVRCPMTRLDFGRCVLGGGSGQQWFEAPGCGDGDEEYAGG
jgi:hypothetical protein